MFHAAVITLFPEAFPGCLGISLIGKALEKGYWKLTSVPLRSFGKGLYKKVDDTCYGGGAGMVLKPDVVHEALIYATSLMEKKPLYVYLTPRGTPLKQNQLQQWSKMTTHLIILCGRYEGVDERVFKQWSFCEISIGDFILCGGEVAAMILLEAWIRLLPSVVGNPESLTHESFSQTLLEHPLYTRPSCWLGQKVPPVLLSGHHQKIDQWKYQEACDVTAQRRPDIWDLFQKNKGSPLKDSHEK